MKVQFTTKLVCVSALAMFLCLTVLDSSAWARRRGPSPAQIKAMQKKIQEQQKMQAGLAKVQAEKDKETLAKFDLNGNGKIDGTEKPAWNKFCEVKLGKTPHPYASITQADVTKAANPPTTKKK